MSAAYTELQDRFARMSAISGAQSMLSWDQATMMPAGGAPVRSRQLAVLSVLQHDILTAPETGGLLDRATAAAGELTSMQRANLNEMHRVRIHACAVPASLVEALSHASAKCEITWRSARADNDFAALSPKLTELVSLVRESAAARADALGVTPYEALVDLYDPGSRVAEIDRLFGELQAFLPDLVLRIMDKQASVTKPVLPTGPFPVKAQEQLARALMQRIGFDFTHGRLDTSHHPFSGGVPEDCRITTRYDTQDFTSSLMAVIHETGHALYERGLPLEWVDQPVGRARGMTVHESQSLLYEMQAARSKEFLGWLSAELRVSFEASGPQWDGTNITALYRNVAPSLIRVDADEVTYPLHIMLRYELERALIDGSMKVSDLPAAWNEGMRQRLGVTPGDDATGCLQDIHWPSGAFGYFPSYTLGALTAAQMFRSACIAEPDILTELARGRFGRLNIWLRDNVHRKASICSTPELIEQATGQILGTATFRAHLEQRYLLD